LSCPNCDLDFKNPSAPVDLGAPLPRCLVCGNDEFYSQKDFNGELGFAVALTSAVVGILVMIFIDPIAGVLFLFLFALMAWIVWGALASCLVCYLCQNIYRGVPFHPDQRGHNLGIDRKYDGRRREWLRQVLSS
jgi:hypothetical protein